MTLSTTATARQADIIESAGPSVFGRWLGSVLKRALPTSLSTTRTPAPRDRALEAADVRALALTMRDADPGFAADLYAAADRHELTPG